MKRVRQLTMDADILKAAETYCDDSGHQFSKWVEKLIKAELGRRHALPAPEQAQEAKFEDFTADNPVLKRYATRADLDAVKRTLNEIRSIVSPDDGR